MSLERNDLLLRFEDILDARDCHLITVAQYCIGWRFDFILLVHVDLGRLQGLGHRTSWRQSDVVGTAIRVYADRDIPACGLR